MQWKTHGERQIYTNPWVNLCLVDVEQPDGRRWEHHVVRSLGEVLGVRLIRRSARPA